MKIDRLMGILTVLLRSPGVTAPELAERFKERRHVLDEHLKQRRPEVYELVVSLREKEETDLK